MSQDAYSAPLQLSHYAITPVQLEDLAGEYYGSIAATVGEPNPDYVMVEFQDRLHPTLGDSINGLTCLNGFLSALDSYRLPNL